MRFLFFLLFALPSFAQLVQAFSETGYSNGVALPSYSAPNQPAWAHLNCTPGTCLQTDQGRVEDTITTVTWHGAMWTNFSWPDNQSASATLLVFANDTTRKLGPAVRLSGNATSISGYAFVYRNGTSQKFLELYRLDANTPTLLDGGSGIWDFTAQDNDVMEISAVGSTISVSVSRSGSSVFSDSAVDANIASGRPGFGALGGSLTGQMATAFGADFEPVSTRPDEWHVTSVGATTGAGTRASPWSWNYARHFAADGMIRCGDIVWIDAGTYSGASQTFSYDGCQGNPITFRAYPGTMPRIQGALGGPSSEVLPITGDYLHFHGFEITEADDGKRWSESLVAIGMVYQQGVLLSGTGSKVINSVIHNTAQGVFQSGVDSEVYGSIIINNGWRSGRGSGHNMYTQGTRFRYITDSFIWGSFGHNIQGFGSDTNAVGLRINGVTGANGGILADASLGYSTGIGADVVSGQGSYTITGVSGDPAAVVTVDQAHGRVVDQDVRLENIGGCTALNGDWLIASVPASTTFTVKNYAGVVQTCNATYTSGGAAIISVFVVDSEVRNSRGFLSVTNNGSIMQFASGEICRDIGLFDSFLAGGQNTATFSDCTDLGISGNTFVGFGGQSRVSGTNFSEGGFPSNTYLTAEPGSGKNVFTEINQYEPTQALVTILNWDTADNTYNYDADAFLQAGDPYEVADAPNPLVVAASGVYDGNAVSLPLNLTAVNTIKGGDWGPTINNISVTSNVATVTLTEAMFSAGILNFVTGNQIKISGAGHANLNGVYQVNEPTSQTVFSFTSSGVPNGNYNGGLAEWNGPYALAHTTNKFNAFIIRRSRTSRAPTTISMKSVAGTATALIEWGYKSGGGTILYDGPKQTLACSTSCQPTIPQAIGPAYYRVTFYNSVGSELASGGGMKAVAN